MTPEPQTIDGILWALAIAAISGFTLIVVPAINRRLAGKLDNATETDKQRLARERKELEEDTQDEILDQETRQIANRLARVAFDREEQLSRLKAEYSEQSELLRLTRKQLEDCKGVEVGEYRHQVAALLEEISVRENVIAKLRNDVAILEATR
jgi:hypothetical protein